MGYTHYFKMKQPRKNVPGIIERIKYYISERDVISFECDEPNKDPQISLNESGEGLFIRFNGKKSNGHETFWFDSQNTDFNFCKTARKPYDFEVCLTLLILKDTYGEDIEVRSDGFSGRVEIEKQHNPAFEVGSIIKEPDGEWEGALSYLNEDLTGYQFVLVCTNIREGMYYDADLKVFPKY